MRRDNSGVTYSRWELHTAVAYKTAHEADVDGA